MASCDLQVCKVYAASCGTVFWSSGQVAIIDASHAAVRVVCAVVSARPPILRGSLNTSVINFVLATGVRLASDSDL